MASRREVQLSMPRVAWSAAAVRHQVRELMRRWELQDLAADTELMTSELVTNVIQHAGGDRYTVVISVSAGLLVVEVFDAEPRMPVLCEPDPARERGRGLATVAALAKDWGASSCPQGKCVWFTLQLPHVGCFP
jgi:anti-sigma regulatory factor (Ser/Thr protein kinase)